MLNRCAETVGKLCKSGGQAVLLCTASTARGYKKLAGQKLYHSKRTVFTHNSGGFTQAINCIFNLLMAGLYPFSTSPITTTTNLIKE